MFLSRLKLSPKNRRARGDLANPYEMHRTLTRVVQNAPHTLYRVEDDLVMVQTGERPDWTQLEPGYASRQVDARQIDYSTVLVSGHPQRFRLRANPCVSKTTLVGESGKKISKRFPLVKMEEQLDWLNKQGQRCGFAVLGAMVSDSGYLFARKERGSQRITVAAATFDGHLRVTDAGLFEKALLQGIGHGKSWGLGLLSLPFG